MQMPQKMPARNASGSIVPLLGAAPSANAGQKSIETAGCCAQVCTPLGCHCVAEAPFC